MRLLTSRTVREYTYAGLCEVTPSVAVCYSSSRKLIPPAPHVGGEPFCQGLEQSEMLIRETRRGSWGGTSWVSRHHQSPAGIGDLECIMRPVVVGDKPACAGKEEAENYVIENWSLGKCGRGINRQKRIATCSLSWL